MNKMTYSVLILPAEEIIECNVLKVLYDAIRRRIRMESNPEGEKFTAYFYKNVSWHEFGFEKAKPFFQMGNE